MDEPTSSLEPDIADKTVSLIEELRRTKKISILYTSHDMNEVTRLCDTVIILDHGAIVAEDSPTALTKRITTAMLRLTVDGPTTPLEKLYSSRGLEWKKSGQYTITVTAAEAKIPELIFAASSVSKSIIDIDIQKPTLEDVFLQIARNRN